MKKKALSRLEFAKGSLALAGTAVLGNVGIAEEGVKKVSKKCMVVYFSWSGNTRFAAETIAKKAGADTFEIKTETPYNRDFNKCCDEAKPECSGKKQRPIKALEEFATDRMAAK